jgi:hypothetical protein
METPNMPTPCTGGDCDDRDELSGSLDGDGDELGTKSARRVSSENPSTLAVAGVESPLDGSDVICRAYTGLWEPHVAQVLILAGP